MPRYISVLKITGDVVWRASTGAWTQVSNCQSFNTANTATPTFRLRSPDASVEIHEFDDPSGSPFCPSPHDGQTCMLVLNRDSLALKKRRVSLKPRSRKLKGNAGSPRKLQRTNPNIQAVKSGMVDIEVRIN
jgi:hypothetical protein